MRDEVSLDFERMKHRDYERLDGMIKGSMRRSAAEVVRLGFLLRRMMDEGLYSVYYLCFDAYLEEELHMDYTAANRFIGINKKYSVGGKSDTIDEKYAEYSQGLLIEMLSMPPELEKQVTPDMTVRQAREIKREAKQKDIKHKPDVYGLMSNPYCSACDTALDDNKQPARCPKCGQLQDWDWYNRTYWPQEQEAPDESKVIEGEYREVNVSEPDQKEEEQSTGLSAYGLPKTEYPEGSLLTTKRCGHKYDCFLCAQECSIRQEERMCQEASLGDPYGCKTVDILDIVRADRGDKCQFMNTELAYKSAGDGSPVPCCKECHEISECAYACDLAKKKALGSEEDGSRADIATSQPHDAAWFVRQYARVRPDEAAQMLEICRKELGNSKRAKAIQEYIARDGCYGHGDSEYGFSFWGFTKGMDFRIGDENMHLKYKDLAAGLMKLLEEAESGTPVEGNQNTRLTEKDEQGNWAVRGLRQEELHVGKTITEEIHDKLYGCLWKLMEYEDTELDPEQVGRIRDRLEAADREMTGMPEQEAMDILRGYPIDCGRPGATKMIAAIGVALSGLKRIQELREIIGRDLGA